MQIIIQTITERKITLEVEVSDSITNVKKKIEEKELITMDAQRIIFNQKELEDEKTLMYYNIVKGNTLYLFLRIKVGMKVFIKTIKGHLLVMEYGDIDKNKEIKAKIEKIVENPPVGQRYFSMSRIEKRELIQLEYNSPDFTDENIKAIILDKKEIPQNDRIILAGERLEDGTTLCRYNTTKNSLRLFQRLADGLEIFIKTIRGKYIYVQVGTLDTNEHIKTKIQEKLGISPDQENFSFVKREIVGDKIVERWVENGKTIPLELDAVERIENIKIIIEAKEKIPCNEQRLFFDEKELENGRNLSNYKVQNKSTIYLVLWPQDGFTIFIKTIYTNKSIIVRRKACDKNEQYMSNFQKKTGLSIVQPYYFAGSEVVGDMIEERWMEYRKTIPLKIQTFDTIKYIKTIIQVIEGVRPDNQYIFFNGKILEEEKVFSDYNIENESTLEVHFTLRSF